MVMLIVYLLIALGVSFLCSILEAVLLSISPGFVATESGKGTRFGRRLKQAKEDIDRPLAAILTLNTFAHTIGAAGVGAQAQHLWGEKYLTVVSVVVTILILIASEIIPKTIGAVAWRRLARPSIAMVTVLVVLLAPFVWLSQLITTGLRRGADTGGSVLSRSDIRVLAEEGYRDGILRRSEKQIIDNLMALSQVNVSEIMVPADAIIGLDANDDVGALHADSPAWNVSRLPVFSTGRIVGYVVKDEILATRLAENTRRPLVELIRPIVVVAPSTPLPDLYARLIEASQHIAAVVDDEKAVGLVTMEDLIEFLLGLEIVDESDAQRDPRAFAEALRQRKARRRASGRREDAARSE